MRKIASMLLVAAILMSIFVPVSAAENVAVPYYVNTNQARLVMAISDTGQVNITVTITCNSKATGIHTITYLERKVGSSWVRVSIGQPGNQWEESVSTRYLLESYTAQVSVKGTYRAVTEITVTGAETDSITLYREDVY